VFLEKIQTASINNIVQQTVPHSGRDWSLVTENMQ